MSATFRSLSSPTFRVWFIGASVSNVGTWMHQVIGGLTPLEPGYARMRIAPRPGGGLTWARAALRTRHGLAEVDWRREGDELVVDAVVPEGAEAVVELPGAPALTVGPGRHRMVADLAT